MGLGIYCLVTGWQIWQFPSMPIPVTAEMDYAIVLGASTKGDQPTPVFRERIREGVRLYQSGKVKKVLFAGGPGNPPQAQVAKALSIKAGVPPQDIMVEANSKNTWENLKFSRSLLAGSKPKVWIVSDPLHLKRALLMAQDLEMEAYPAPTTSSAYKGFWSKLKFTLREIAAYSYYRIKRIF